MTTNDDDVENRAEDDASIIATLEVSGFGDRLRVETESYDATVIVQEDTGIEQNEMGHLCVSTLVEQEEGNAPWDMLSLRWLDKLNGVLLDASRGGSSDVEEVEALEVLSGE